MYKKIGVVIAMEEELKDVAHIFGNVVKSECVGSFLVREYLCNDKEIFIISSGIGNIRSAMGTQLLIEKWEVEVVINCGLAGGLSDDLHGQQELLVDKVVAYDFSLNVSNNSARGKLVGESSPYMVLDYSKFPWLDKLGLRSVICASADKFVNYSPLKTELIDSFGADICEMESYGIVSACKIYHVPCIILKAISDMADESANKSIVDVMIGVVDFYKKSLHFIIDSL